MGELLKEMPKNEGTRGNFAGRDTSGAVQFSGSTQGGTAGNDTPTLADLGVSRKQSARFQAVAAIPALSSPGLHAYITLYRVNFKV